MYALKSNKSKRQIHWNRATLPDISCPIFRVIPTTPQPRLKNNQSSQLHSTSSHRNARATERDSWDSVYGREMWTLRIAMTAFYFCYIVIRFQPLSTRVTERRRFIHLSGRIIDLAKGCYIGRNIWPKKKGGMCTKVK